MKEKQQVKCIECGRAMHSLRTSLQLEREGIVLIFEDVPSIECPYCGEQEIPGTIAEEVSVLAEYFMKAKQMVAELPVPVERININLAPQIEAVYP
ncbi:YgiT-type zinc finger protein [bacterium]|nr:YgiT-type zinc finger protein [bacterium]MBU1615378.1 YgiT-type zinc finger protein [bacterium]